MIAFLRKLFAPAPAQASSMCTCLTCGRSVHRRDSGAARFHYDGDHGICDGSGRPGKAIEVQS